MVVGVEGIEPSASRSRTERSTDELHSEYYASCLPAGRVTDTLHPE